MVAEGSIPNTWKSVARIFCGVYGRVMGCSPRGISIEGRRGLDRIGEFNRMGTPDNLPGAMRDRGETGFAVAHVDRLLDPLHFFAPIAQPMLGPFECEKLLFGDRFDRR